MDRKEFLGKTACFGLCGSIGVALGGSAMADEQTPSASPEGVDEAKAKMINWISDLVTNATDEGDRGCVAKLLEACGQGCFRRGVGGIPAEAKGNLDSFIAQFQKALGADNVKREGKVVHVRFPLEACVCPVAKAVPVRPNDLFCNCSRGWLQAGFAIALERIPTVECVESFRRGGQSCRFDVHVG